VNPTRDFKPSLDDVRRLVAPAFPNETVNDFEELTGGLCNKNLKVNFTRRDPVVLRLYQRHPQVAETELALLRRLRGSLPVPEVFYVGSDEVSGNPYALIEYVTGITFQTLKQNNDLPAIQQASYSSGKVLAAIGQYTFPSSGPLLFGLKVGAPYFGGVNPAPHILDQCLLSEDFQRRTTAELRVSLHDFIWSWSKRLADFDGDCQLVHSDFGPRNILVREIQSRWQVVAVLDWEFAFSGSPLIDVGHFLRYEKQTRPLREPHFSAGFLEHGGKLPEDWWQLGRVIDLTALCDLLTRENLPDELASEVLDLIHATLNDPVLR
jgi:aminoglycoside phosphotransferase (APT) family kinase protein